MSQFPTIREYENFHGFGTVHFYEAEANKCGQKTKRIPCVSENGTACFVLLTQPPEPCSAQALDGMDIITEDEAVCLYSGAARHNSDLTDILHSLGFSFLSEKSVEQEELIQFSFFG